MSDSPDAMPAPDAGNSPGGDGTRQVVLVKNNRRFIFRFNAGDEAQILQSIVDMVRDPQSELDWFDAALLSHQIGQHLGRELEQLRKG